MFLGNEIPSPSAKRGRAAFPSSTTSNVVPTFLLLFFFFLSIFISFQSTNLAIPSFFSYSLPLSHLFHLLKRYKSIYVPIRVHPDRCISPPPPSPSPNPPVNDDNILLMFNLLSFYVIFVLRRIVRLEALKVEMEEEVPGLIS